MDRLPAPDSHSKLRRPASARVHGPASARSAAGLGPVAGRRAAHAAVAGANAWPRLPSAARAQHPAAAGAGRSQVVPSQRDTLLHALHAGSADPGAATAAATAVTTAEELAGVAARQEAGRDAPAPRPTRNAAAEQRAPWSHAQHQHAALTALAGGTASRAQRDFLIEEIRRQVPDVAYLAQTAAGARTVLSLIIPGNRALGLKTLNDHVVGYQINNSMIGPQRNQAVKDAFLGARAQPAGTSPFTVAEQTYKLTTVTSPLAPPQLGAPLTGALQTI